MKGNVRIAEILSYVILLLFAWLFYLAGLIISTVTITSKLAWSTQIKNPAHGVTAQEKNKRDENTQEKKKAGTVSSTFLCSLPGFSFSCFFLRCFTMNPYELAQLTMLLQTLATGNDI